MESSDLHAVTVRLDVLRDIMIELAAALPADRAAGIVTAIGNRLTERLCDMAIDEPTDDAMVSDLAPHTRGLAPLARRDAIDLAPSRGGQVARRQARSAVNFASYSK